MKSAIKCYIASIVASITALGVLLIRCRKNEQLVAKYKDIFDTIKAMPIGQGIITSILVILMLPVILLGSMLTVFANKFKK